MIPISPVFPSHPKLEEIVFAKDQPQYRPLPAFVDSSGTVVSRWKLTWKERFQVLFGGCLWLQLMTFGGALQPSLITTEEPKLKESVM